MEIRRYPTPNFIRGREGHVPRAVVVHTTDGTFLAAVRTFAKPDGVSAHYLVGLDGRVTQFVDETDTARHTGRVHEPTASFLTDENPNLYTVGIEFEDGGEPHGVERTDEQYRAGAALLREIARRWRLPLDRAHVVGHREIYARKTCPGNLDIDRLLREARASASVARVETGAARLVCLLPARDVAEDVPGYLHSAARFCDAIVALDDGSTDGTLDLLAASPLVAILLTKPRRRGYRGWDDGANRNSLLAAASELEPDWILSLDADERIDEGDARALRDFLDTDALPGCAYGLQHVRMWGDDACESGIHWIYRLFAHEEGQVFPARRLHFNPIPTSIPRRVWVRTTIRVQHFGASTERRRLARLAKYRHADPGGRTDFGGLDASPRGELQAWRPRPRGLPVLVER